MGKRSDYRRVIKEKLAKVSIKDGDVDVEVTSTKSVEEGKSEDSTQSLEVTKDTTVQEGPMKGEDEHDGK